MNSARKARLKAKGWRSGSAADFLGLSPEESYFVELKLRLADDLKLRRTKGRISQEQLAVLLGSSQSRVAKMESADASVSLDLMIRALLALRAKPSEIAGAIERAAR